MSQTPTNHTPADGPRPARRCSTSSSPRARATPSCTRCATALVALRRSAASGAAGARRGPSACCSRCRSSSSAPSPSASGRTTAAGERPPGSSTSPRAARELQPRARLPRERAAPRAARRALLRRRRAGRGVVVVAALPARGPGAAGTAADEQARRRHRLDAARDRPAAGVGAARRRHRLRLGPADEPARREPLVGAVPAAARPRDGLHLRDAPAHRGHRLLDRHPLRRAAGRGRGAVLVSILLGILDQLDALDPYRNAFPGHYSRAGRTRSR